MTFSESITTCFNKYASFEGRASLSEYWWWYLFSLIYTFVFGFIGGIVGGIVESTTVTSIIAYVPSLAILLPSISVAVRRLHDIGKSGAWFFIGFIPIIGWIWFLVLMCTSSEPYDNQYGPGPYQQHF